MVERCQRDQPGLEQAPELGILERPVEEVRPQCRHYPNPPPTVFAQCDQAVEEKAPHLLIGHHREKLLELVEHQHHLGVVGRENLFDHSEQAPIVGGQVIDHPLRSLNGDAEKGGLEFFEGVGAGEHICHQPVARARDGASPERREQTGADDAGLAAARRPDDHDQAVTADGLGESVDRIVATEEVGRICLLKCSEPLIGIAKGFRRGRFDRSARRLPPHRCRPLDAGRGGSPRPARNDARAGRRWLV